MYAVIKTGGKQYRVQPGDVMVVEKLDGDVGAAVKFEHVLAHGEGAELTLGAPVIDGAVVHATLIETRKGEKVKIFKKIRRQGYRRTRGHRQIETVLRVTGLEIGGKTVHWEGEVNLAPKALLDAKARGLKHEIAVLEGSSLVPAVVEHAPDNVVAAEAPATPEAASAIEAEAQTAAPETTAAEIIDTVGTEADGVTEETVAPKKKAAPKARPASDDEE
jgi:large subunit ribosomal protein L21